MWALEALFWEGLTGQKMFKDPQELGWRNHRNTHSLSGPRGQEVFLIQCY